MDAAATIRQLREQAGMDVIELAFRAGVSPRTIERIEAGTSVPHRSTLRVLYGVLGEPEVDAAA